MKTKQQKKETVKDLSKKMPEAEMVVFTSYSRTGEKGLSVAKMRELKKVLRGMGAEYVVAKKNLIRIAAEQVHFGELVDVGSFDGSVGVVVGPKEGDSVALSKKSSIQLCFFFGPSGVGTTYRLLVTWIKGAMPAGFFFLVMPAMAS